MTVTEGRMQGKEVHANGQPVHGQDGDRLTCLFKTGMVKAEGLSVEGVMQGEWRFCRGNGDPRQVGHF
ncbi:MAG TPA: hypothetical protein PKC84_05030, partial [Paracoccaceae bacterium]|nr:hypothetical protein [Paracoccaceae bacterium]